MKGRLLLVAGAALSLCMLASCAYVYATTTQYVGVPRFDAIEPAAVQVLKHEPLDRTHERLGEIVLEISVDPAPPVSDIEKKLLEEGAKLGASAVFIAKDVVFLGRGRTLIGVAIRYR